MIAQAVESEKQKELLAGAGLVGLQGFYVEQPTELVFYKAK